MSTTTHWLCTTHLKIVDRRYGTSNAPHVGMWDLLQLPGYPASARPNYPRRIRLVLKSTRLFKDITSQIRRMRYVSSVPYPKTLLWDILFLDNSFTNLANICRVSFQDPGGSPNTPKLHFNHPELLHCCWFWLIFLINKEGLVLGLSYCIV
jgi:hypothetical protein